MCTSSSSSSSSSCSVSSQGTAFQALRTRETLTAAEGRLCAPWKLTHSVRSSCLLLGLAVCQVWDLQHLAERRLPVQVEYEDVDDLAAVAADVDVLYQTRIQKERFQV